MRPNRRPTAQIDAASTHAPTGPSRGSSGGGDDPDSVVVAPSKALVVVVETVSTEEGGIFHGGGSIAGIRFSGRGEGVGLVEGGVVVVCDCTVEAGRGRVEVKVV